MADGTHEIDRYLAERAKLIENNAYDPASEKDACGVGLVCAIGVLLIADANPLGLSVQLVGEVLLWVAAALTVKTGWDYLHAGLIHMTGAEQPAQPTAPPPPTAKPSQAT